MLSYADERWAGLTAGYRTVIDLRPLLGRLESAEDPSSIWPMVWEELYHQGDVGPGSFVAVPHLIRIHGARGSPDWNTYALTATIELARGLAGNPDVPPWASDAYHESLAALGRRGLIELPLSPNVDTTRSILGFLALVHGARTYGRLLVEFSEDELLVLERAAFGDA